LAEIIKDWPHFWGISIPTITSLFCLEVRKSFRKENLKTTDSKKEKLDAKKK